jgi:anaerobic ribonucleoside-triphosphate reductase activating protein
MKSVNIDVLLREVPTEISLAFYITGCKLNCKGCHWKEANDNNLGDELTMDMFHLYLDKYHHTITNVLFMGGEWEKDNLIEFLKVVKMYNLKTSLYTGLNFNEIDIDILNNLNYIKCGRWVEDLGGLESEITNQRLINLDTKEDITHLFRFEDKEIGK